MHRPKRPHPDASSATSADAHRRRRRWLTLTGLGLLLASMALAAEPRPPESMTEEGACPFECCTYREWTVLVDTPLREAPNDRARILGKARKGATVQGLTGIVIVTKPGQMEVLRDYSSAESGHSYQRGDIVWIYTERGEGFFEVWHDGETYDEEAAFMYQDRGGRASCVDAGTCWEREWRSPNRSGG